MDIKLQSILLKHEKKQINYLVLACGYTANLLVAVEEIQLIAECFDSQLILIHDSLRGNCNLIEVPSSLYIRCGEIVKAVNFLKAVPEEELKTYKGSICFECPDTHAAMCITSQIMKFRHCKGFKFDNISTYMDDVPTTSGENIMYLVFDTKC